MTFSRPSFAAVSFAVMLSLLAVPSAVQAGPFDCLFPSPTVSPAPTQTVFMPNTVQRVSYMPTACNPCAPQVSYVPETKRRWTYSRIPKTTYKPVTTCDPCTGCPVTTYRPITTHSLLPWLHRKSYTVYKQVAAPMASYNPCATNSCNPCGGGSAVYSSGTTSGCSTCAPPATLSGSIGSPSPSDGDPYYQKKTFKGDPQPKPDNSIPNQETSTEMPELPVSRDRMAARPIELPADVRAVSWELDAAPASPAKPAPKRKLDVSGWRAVID